MKLTGPDAQPPEERRSWLPRRREKFVPVPEPYLKSIPSVRARPRIDSMESSTELMKHAEHCGCSSIPMLNQTGELKEAIWWISMWVSSDSKLAASSSVARTPSFVPQTRRVRTTRSTISRALLSRPGRSTAPLKYLLTTTFVASCDQKAGTSTSFCSKMTSPSSFAMTADRVSHVIPS
jgi:hypothetical protein